MSDRSRTRGLHQGTTNHKPGCACPPCKNKRYEALCLQSKELEMRVLTLTDELDTAKESNRVLGNVLNESRKISQEREKQLKESEQKLAHFMGRTSAAEAYLKTVQEALDCKDPAKLAERAQKLQSDLGEEKRLHNLSKMSDANARGILTQIHTELGGDPDRPALDKVQGLVWQLENSRAEAESRRVANQSLERDLSKAIADKNMMGGQYEAEFARATGHMHGRTKAEQERDEAQAALKLANASIESLQRGNEQLGRKVDALTPRLSPWARIAFAVLGIFLIAYWSHRAGFDAAMTLRGGAR